MSATTYGPYLYGIPASFPFKLPKGWRWLISPHHWMRAISPDGRRWIAGKDHLRVIERETERETNLGEETFTP